MAFGRTVTATGDGPRGVDPKEALDRARRESGRALADLRRVRWIDCDLAGLDLSNVDLSGADLSGSDLRGAILRGSSLRGATLFGAHLEGCELLGADLGGANLGEVNAERTGFGGVDLGGANLSEAKLSGATFGRARLDEAVLRRADLRRARLHEASLLDADFAHADLREAELVRCAVGGGDFSHCDLREARLVDLAGYPRASWLGVDVREADFRGALQLRRFVLDENYLAEFRARSRATAALYWVWWATSDCGRSFGRWALWTLLLIVSFGLAYPLVEIDYGDHPTRLSPYYFSLVTLTTLGYGDVLPASLPAQALAMLEVSVGYLALGGLISIFANKMARRAE